MGQNLDYKLENYLVNGQFSIVKSEAIRNKRKIKAEQDHNILLVKAKADTRTVLQRVFSK